MSTTRADADPQDGTTVQPDAEGRPGWLAAGGVTGAILASTCCILPLVLVMLGVSGAWIGNLTALTPYKQYFAIVSLLFIAGGFWQVYFGARPACGDGPCCARPHSSLITRFALWIATALVLLSLTIGWWAPLFY